MFKLVLHEPGSKEMSELLVRVRRLACARVGHVELRAALASAQRAGRTERRDHARIRDRFRKAWSKVTPVEIDESLLDTAVELAEEHGLRAYDAVHIAALTVVGPPRYVDLFACWDKELRAVAKRLGYRLFPEVG